MTAMFISTSIFMIVITRACNIAVMQLHLNRQPTYTNDT
jgi:hypothetical protein